ncbi:MAG: hypothetical protein GY948_01955 [Alphaproteobacteria bacterium]|nr:hypothetical protein [Alphaproteobacteria bacterium]
MLKYLKKFRSDEDGNIAIIFGFAVVPFMMVAGMAVDYGRGVVAKHELQVALDSAVLAAGSLRLADAQDRKDLGKAFFEANFDAARYGMTVPSDLISISNNVISADETLSVDTAFMQLSSMLSGQTVDEMQLQSDATALVPQVGTAEISLVLDYSGSMDDYLNGAKKYVTMRNAAKDLINSLHTASGGTSDDIEFSLVPFSYGVKASLMNKHVTDESYNKLVGDTRAESCFSGRKKNNTTDTEPTDGKRHRWQQKDLWYDKGSYNADRSYKCSDMLAMRELTSVTGTLLSDLNSWEPDGGTHISSGFQFGWHSISPNSVFPGGATYDKITHEDPEQRVMKAIVLLTDGAQTVPAYRKNGAGQDNPETSDPDWPMDKTNGEYNLEQQCENAKAEGIIVVTVAFDLDDDDTIDRLEGCASPKNPDDEADGKYAFTANTTSQLQTAFQEIGDILAEMVYLSN